MQEVAAAQCLKMSRLQKGSTPLPAAAPLKKGGQRQILIVDDHPIVRHGLSKLLNQDPALHVCGEAEDYQSAVRLAQTCDPDLAIIDISLKGRDGIDLIKVLKAGRPRLPVLVLSMHDETLYAERALRAGASGYIRKQEANRFLMDAVHKVLEGQIYLSNQMEAKMLDQVVDGQPGRSSTPLSRLTDREMEVFNLLGQGKSTAAIARALRLSIKTVEAHRAHIREKLRLETGNELVIYAIRCYQSDRA